MIDDCLVKIPHLAKDILLAYLTQTRGPPRRRRRESGCPHPRRPAECGDEVARKGRTRRFCEARQLEQGDDDRLFTEVSGTLADLEDADEKDDDLIGAGVDAWSETTRPSRLHGPRAEVLV
jgi:hypothetical protein